MQTYELVIYDSEFTAWEGSLQRNWSLEWEQREIIQLAALKVQLSNTNVEVTGSFNQLIKPRVNPNISDYIAQLTGINQQMLNEQGIDFESSLALFHQFCANGQLKAFAWGHDARVLQENCAIYDINMPNFSAGLYDLRELAQTLQLSGSQAASGELVGELGIKLNGHVHNALFDVRSIAAALDYWIKSREVTPEKFLQGLAEIS